MLELRFIEKVEVTDVCWEWSGAHAYDGYGRFSALGKTVMAHRFSYEIFNGEIPENMVVDHLCRNRSCVNPDHLRVTTRVENIKQGLHNNGSLYQCRRGHPFIGDNLYRAPDGRRYCRTCRKLRKCARGESNSHTMKAPDPKSGASTSSATGAFTGGFGGGIVQ